MRIALLSDIHSNLEALTKALVVADDQKVDEVYCCGDIVGYGGNPIECVELIRSRAKFIVLGNHDQAAVDVNYAKHFTKAGKIAAGWTHDRLGKANLEYLAGLPFRIETEHCTLVHSSPSAPEEWEYVVNLPAAAMQFERFTTPLCFIGHTHIPEVCGEDLKTFVVKPGKRFLINVGSVGQPRDGRPELSFGILDTEKWSYENVRAPYDVRGAARAILSQGLPEELASRLFKGI